jgi:DNA-binding IclR family transcriptional regulator
MQTIERVFAILKLIAQQNGEIRVSRIAERLSLPKSTVSRFLVALEAEGMVHRTPENRFSLGEQLLALTRKPHHHQGLIAAARPALMALNQQTGESVALSVLDGHAVTYLFHLESQHAVQVVDWTGESVPLHVSSSGKLLLANSSQTLIDDYAKGPFKAFTKRSIICADQLKINLATIRKQGFAVSDEEFAPGVIGYAVPLRDASQNIVAAITVYGPKYRLDNPEETLAVLNRYRKVIENKISRRN